MATNSFLMPTNPPFSLTGLINLVLILNGTGREGQRSEQLLAERVKGHGYSGWIELG